MKSFYIIFIFILLILMMCFIHIFNKLMNDIYKQKKDIIVINEDIKPSHHHKQSQRDFIRRFDKESKTNPFMKQFNRPENSQLGDLNVRKYFDIHTRGEPNDFHIIGTLNRINNKPPENKEIFNNFIDDNRILNLYGRARYPTGSSPYEYYTRITSGKELIKIDLGERPELMDDSTIYIPELEAEYKLKKYPNDMFRYNPFDY